jgi:hypothetical protein
VAFVAGVLLARAEPDEQDPGEAAKPNGAEETQSPDADALSNGARDIDEHRDHGDGRGVDDPAVSDDAGDDHDDSAHREALLERAVVVHDDAAWRRWIAHEQPLILIPIFDDPTIDAALGGGHHVLLPRIARSGDRALPPLHRGDARTVWERAGVGFPQADELARAARRSLTSLRRRIGRAGRFRQPAWADSTSANLLAPLLLAGSWTDDVDGDRTVVTALAERATWRSVARDLAPLTGGDDAPLVERQHRWEYVDIVDAWDALSPVLTSEDLDVFHDQAISVLAEPDPTLTLRSDERRKAAFSLAGLPRRRHSGSLRRGMTNTLALLGAVAGERVLPGGRTGAEHAAAAVRELLGNATGERWMSLADLLPVIAEAAPNVFLDAVEESLHRDAPPIMILFEEEDNPLALSASSRHTSLLWALEALAFSVQHVSRVAVILGQLAERDPGGRLANRPAASLQAVLHLLHPQSAVNNVTRLQVVDAVRRAAPEAGWKLLLSLINGVERGLVLHHGPRFRDWPRESPQPTYSAIVEAANELAIRIADEASGDGERWTSAMGVMDEVPPAGRVRMLQALDDTWVGLDIDAQRGILEALDERANRHALFRDAAWALDDDSLDGLQGFIRDHALPGLQAADHQLFSWWPARPGMDDHTDGGRAALAGARSDAVGRALAHGLDGVIRLAEQSEVPETIGVTLAAVTDEFDGPVLDLLAGDPTATRRLAHALARVRGDADPQWLRAMVDMRPEQAVSLLLTAELDDALLNLLEDLRQDQRADFWRRVQPWRVPPALVATVCEQLLAHDRPVSAMWVVEHADEAPFPVDLAVEAMRAAVMGSEERLDSIQSPTYVVGQLLDKLEAAGLPAKDLAELEWMYSPMLHHERSLTALNRWLASDPEFFAQLVTMVYKSDASVPDENAADARSGGDEDAHVEQDPDEGPEPGVVPHLFDAAWNVLREWRSPPPGSPDGSVPSSEQMQVWVDAVRRALQDAGRSQVASIAIGQALSGPAMDADGTWPSEPLRDLLEHEQDSSIEEALVIGRVNQRGVTMRGAYDGGAQERKLVAQYKAWADKVRDDWPRAGAVLDDLTRIYSADARREDASAERQAEM